jgi:hypothetical protein
MSRAIGLWGRARSRWRRLSLTLVVALAGGITLSVPSGTASADLFCLNAPGSSYILRFDNPYIDQATGQLTTFHFPDNHTHAHVALVFWIRSSTLTFNPAAGAFVDNGTDQTIMGTFSTTQSKTFTISETVTTGVSSSLLGTTFSSSISNTITSSITTSTTITASGPVPPHSRVNGDFGVDAYNAIYDVDFWQLDQGTCWYHGAHRNVGANLPTTRQGWHLYPAQPL